jgi:hypothetical protein
VDMTKSERGPSIGLWLQRFLSQAPAMWKIGEVAIRPNLDLVHWEDRAADPLTLREIKSWEDLRELIRLDADGKFRPLRAAPRLPRGWLYRSSDGNSLQTALDYIYPAALANWSLQVRNELPVTSWRETAERQTGRFRVVREIDAAALDDLVAHYCQRGCLKRRLWPPADQRVDGARNEIPLLCPEACNFLVEQARGKLKGPGEGGV